TWTRSAAEPAGPAHGGVPCRYAAGMKPAARPRSPCLLLAAGLALAMAATAREPSVADPQYTACMARLKAQAAARGVPAAGFERLMAGVAADRSVLALLDAQPEFTTPVWDYLAGLVDEERVADGLAMLEAHRDLLARVEAEYGVDPATVVAVWGVESDYGRITGKRPLLQSLSTLSCF